MLMLKQASENILRAYTSAVLNSSCTENSPTKNDKKKKIEFGTMPSFPRGAKLQPPPHDCTRGVGLCFRTAS